jgi:mRNA interferase RelE/StbE
VKILYAKSFDNDIVAVRHNPEVKKRLLEAIEKLKEVDSLDTLHDVRHIEGYSHYYRIRIGDYRLGIKLVGDSVELIRFLNRKDIYRRFP